MSFLQKLKGYRTLIVNGIAFVAALLVATGVITVDQVPDANAVADHAEAVANAADHLNDSAALAAGIAAGLALVNVVLRLVTTTPMGKKAP